MRCLLPGLLTLTALSWLPSAAAQQLPLHERDVFVVEPIAERTVTQLPEGPLYWVIEAFPDLAGAETAAGPLSLAAEHAGQAWLLTLSPKGAEKRGGTQVAAIGPVPVVSAHRYLLRVNRAGGPPGAMTPVHSHLGSEAFYVLSGRLSQRTSHGMAHVEAGETMNGHGADLAMQLTSAGTTDLDQLVMFVVDADRPFSSPATFE